MADVKELNTQPIVYDDAAERKECKEIRMVVGGMRIMRFEWGMSA